MQLVEGLFYRGKGCSYSRGEICFLTRIPHRGLCSLFPLLHPQSRNARLRHTQNHLVHTLSRLVRLRIIGFRMCRARARISVP